MSLNTTETIQRLFSQFVREALGDIPPEQRSRYQAQFEKRAQELVKGASLDSTAAGKGFSDLIGLGDKGVMPFDSLPFPHNEADFDE
jgi:hypothetical protein